MDILSKIQLVWVAQFLLLTGLILTGGILAHLYFLYNPLLISFSETKTISKFTIETKAHNPVLMRALSFMFNKNIFRLKHDHEEFYLLTEKTWQELRETKNIHRKEIKSGMYKEI